jgi:tubulin gamma
MLERQSDGEIHAQTPILENMVVGVPPVFEGLTRQLDTIVEQPLLGPKTKFPIGKNKLSGLGEGRC